MRKNFGLSSFTFDKKYFYFILIAFLVFISDFMTKFLVYENNLHTTGHLVDFTPVFNPGSLFGLFSNVYAVNIFFIFFSFVALAGLFYLFFKFKFLLWPVALIVGGILGNLLNRLVYSRVFDFIDFHFWPVFNLADSAILVGVILTIFLLFRNDDSLVIKN